MLANRFRYFYFGLLVATSIVAILSSYILKQSNMLMNVSELKDYNEVHASDKYSDNEKLRLIVPQEILLNEKRFEDDIKKTMSYVATAIDGRYTSNPNLTAFQKLDNIINQNGGGICGDLAIILKEILEVKGYRARTVQLIRQIGSNYDTHVVAEVFDENLKKYILLDPTFNIMFQTEKKYLNANEVRQNYLYKKNIFKIIEFEGRNVQKYSKYPLDYLSLYNNVLIVKANSEQGIKRLISKFPIVHNYFGRKYFIVENRDSTNISKLYSLFYFYIPLFVLISIIVIAVNLMIKFFKRY